MGTPAVSVENFVEKIVDILWTKCGSFEKGKGSGLIGCGNKNAVKNRFCGKEKFKRTKKVWNRIPLLELHRQIYPKKMKRLPKSTAFSPKIYKFNYAATGAGANSGAPAT